MKFLTVKNMHRTLYVCNVSRRMTATAGQSPRQIGKIAADRAYKILNGESVEKIIKLPTKLLSAENISAADLDSWD